MSLVSRKLGTAAAGAGGAGGGSYLAINSKSNGILRILDHTTPGTVTAGDTIQVGGGGNDGYSCQFSSDDSFIVACSEGDPRVHLINSSNISSLSSTDSINAGWRSSSIALSPDDSYVAIGYWDYNSYNPSIQIFSISSGSLSLSSTTATTGNTNTGGGSIMSIDFSPDGNYLAVFGRAESSSHGRIWLYSFSSGSITLAATYDGGSSSSITYYNGVRFSPDGSMIGASMYNKIKFFTYTSNSITNTGEESISGGGVFYSFSWKPDGSQIATCASGQKKLSVYNVSNSGATISAGPTYTLPEVSFCSEYSPDGNYIACSVDNATSFVLLDSSNPSSLSLADSLSSGYYTTGDRMSWSHS
tara:strand:+ start:1554 stop:2630 length:1077 start_codon:yes stop_codon:yes gene_type:complete